MIIARHRGPLLVFDWQILWLNVRHLSPLPLLVVSPLSSNVLRSERPLPPCRNIPCLARRRHPTFLRPSPSTHPWRDWHSFGVGPASRCPPEEQTTRQRQPRSTLRR